MTAPSLDRLACLALHRVGLMGNEDKAAYQRWILPGMTVVDIGANQGLYALLFSGLVGPTGSVLAFEPEPDMFTSLVQNCRANAAANVECQQLALGARAGAGTLHRSLIHGGDNRIAPGLNDKITKSVEIRIATLDEAVGARRVDFIKMDVQGWESEVFQGMDQVLRNNENLQIYFEFWPQALRNAGANPRDVLAFLIARRFRLNTVREDREVPLPDASIGESWAGYRFTNIYARR
jgi:FkbM family methyltransferase